MSRQLASMLACVAIASAVGAPRASAQAQGTFLRTHGVELDVGAAWLGGVARAGAV